MREARSRLPLKTVIGQRGGGPEAGGNWKRFKCPFCGDRPGKKGKKRAGLFEHNGIELFKCFSTSCPSGAETLDEVGFIAVKEGLSRRDAFQVYLKEAGVWKEVERYKAPRKSAGDGAADPPSPNAIEGDSSAGDKSEDLPGEEQRPPTEVGLDNDGSDASPPWDPQPAENPSDLNAPSGGDAPQFGGNGDPSQMEGGASKKPESPGGDGSASSAGRAGISGEGAPVGGGTAGSRCSAASSPCQGIDGKAVAGDGVGGSADPPSPDGLPPSPGGYGGTSRRGELSANDNSKCPPLIVGKKSLTAEEMRKCLLAIFQLKTVDAFELRRFLQCGIPRVEGLLSIMEWMGIVSNDIDGPRKLRVPVDGESAELALAAENYATMAGRWPWKAIVVAGAKTPNGTPGQATQPKGRIGYFELPTDRDGWDAEDWVSAALQWFWERLTLSEKDAESLWVKRGLESQTQALLGYKSNPRSNLQLLESMRDEFPAKALLDSGLFRRPKRAGEGIQPTMQFAGLGIAGKKPAVLDEEHQEEWEGEDEPPSLEASEARAGSKATPGRKGKKNDALWAWDACPILIPYFDASGRMISLRPHRGNIKGFPPHLYVPRPAFQKSEEKFSRALLTEAEFKAAAFWQAGRWSGEPHGAAGLPGIAMARVDTVRMELDEWLHAAICRECVVVFDNETKSDPELPGYQPKRHRRFDSEIYARWTAASLEKKSRVRGTMSRLPDAWKDEKGKTDWDGAMARFVHQPSPKESDGRPKGKG